MKIAVLALQGAFIEHEKVLSELGAECIELRNAEDLQQDFDALVLPGGESTVQGKLLRESGMFEPLKERIEADMSVLATCAGMILLADHIADDDTRHFATIPMTVKRNAYGRQLGSFHAYGELETVGQVPMTFIRAPYVVSVEDGVEVLAQVDGRIVAVRYGNQLALAFHPELDADRQVHSLFIEAVEAYLHGSQQRHSA